jgi:hypothetical protein
MTKLRLKLNQPLAQGHLEGAAVATVRLLTDAGNNMSRSRWSKQLPVDISGWDESLGDAATFDLPGGGLYGVTITRPRGEHIEREFLVKEGEDRSEMIKLEVSPHEYLGWQQYAGIVRSNPYQPEAATRSIDSKPSGNVRTDELLVQGSNRIASLYNRAKSVPQLFGATLPGTREAWSMVHAATRGGDQPWTRAMGPLNWQHRPDSEYLAWFPLMPDSGAGYALIDQLRQPSIVNDSLAKQFPRWVTFQNGSEIDLVSVPWAWWGGSRQQDEEIRFLYDMIRPSAVDRDSPGHVVLTVQDRRWFGLLEFLASGQLQQADHIVSSILPREDPESALYGKAKGPLIAVAGAIVLIAGAETSLMQTWDRWLENLSEWFPGIPDGPIVLGCRRVEQASNLDELRKAYAHLRMGIDRGIPFFSACIRMLALALAQIGDEIPEADQDRRHIASVSTRVDPDQAFTVIRL